MSNHRGGCLLNEVFHLLVENNFVTAMGKKKMQHLVLEITRLACRKYDCNGSEILNDLGKTFGVCSCCLQPVIVIRENVCLKCRKEDG